MSDNTLFEKHTDMFNGDIGMYYCGKRIGTKNHVYGPRISSHFLILLVESGTAVLYKDGEEMTFKDKDMLVMFPGEKIMYKAQTEWTNKWIGVSGSQIEDIFRMIGVTRGKPIFTPEKYDELSNIMSKIYNVNYDNSMLVKYKTQALLYEFFATLLAEKSPQKSIDPIDSAIQIMRYNYNNDLNIKDIASGLFLDNAYFSRLFKSKTGVSPKKFILQNRMNRAKELLGETNYHIKEISVMVGFNDPLYFSKIFYKTEGITPSEYRSRRQNKNECVDIKRIKWYDKGSK